MDTYKTFSLTVVKKKFDVAMFKGFNLGKTSEVNDILRNNFNPTSAILKH